MKLLLQNTWPLFFGIAMIMVGNGLQGTLIGVRATIEGFSTATTGLIMSLYYGGYLAGCILAPKLVSNVGHIRVFAGLASLASTVALIHGLFINPLIWGVARIFTGFCFASIYIVIESWMNDVSTNENRGKILGTYLMVFYGAMVVGQYLLYLAPPENIDLFILTSILVSLALLPVSLSKRPAPDFQEPKTISIKALYKASPLGVFGVIIAGTGSGILFGLAPVFAVKAGMSITAIANFVSMFILGGMLAQLPLGLLSDKIERRKLIIATAFLSALSSCLCYLVADSGFMLYLMFCLLGSTSLSIYGLCVSYTNDHLSNDQFVGASAMLILINGCGAFIGPVIAAVGMSTFGPKAFFPTLALFYIVLTVYAIYRSQVREAIPLEEQGDLIAVSPRATPVTAQIAEESEDNKSAQQASR